MDPLARSGQIPPKLLVHIDVDSPAQLLRFYREDPALCNAEQLVSFYKISFQRTLELFDRLNLKASFFVVGEELNLNPEIASVIKQAHLSGHEFENHTYSHVFGLASLSADAIRKEVQQCNAAIHSVTGRKPVGFRAPGCSMNTKIMNVLEEEGFEYDSSGFWSVMNVSLKFLNKLLYRHGVKDPGFGDVNHRLPQHPYYPDKSDWLKIAQSQRKIIELPLPRSRFSQLPFYNNMNLWLPDQVASLATTTINRSCLVYLFHSIEFLDRSDNVPDAVCHHPNLRRPVSEKMKRSEKYLKSLLTRYEASSTSDFLNKFRTI